MSTFKLAFGDTSRLSAAIRTAIGVGPYDEVECVTPQFTRTDGKQIVYFPHTVLEFNRLKTLDKATLKEIGLGAWDESGLMLFPGEWYHHIPAGYMVTCIDGTESPWEPGVSDDDIRFGCLAYGIIPFARLALAPAAGKGEK